MTAPNILRIRSEMGEGGNPRTLARVVNQNGVVLTTDDFDGTGGAIAYTVYDEQAADPSTPVVSTALLTPANVISSLSTTGWAKDDTGYNFDFKITDSAVCAEGGHTYRIEYGFVLDNDAGNDNDTLWVVHTVDCKSLGSG
jgi:hypothetical protein